MSDTDLTCDHHGSRAERQRDRAKAWFESLRDMICAEIEALEREAPARA